MYTKQLGKRLLQSHSDDALEQKLAEVLKSECGEHFTTKVEQMFNDVQSSRDLVQQFKALPGKSDCDVDFKILEQKMWPVDISLQTKAMDEENKQLQQQSAQPADRRASSSGGRSSGKQESGNRDGTAKMPQSRQTVALPKQLNDMFSSFQTFYKSQFKGRRIDIVYEFGSCVIQVNLAKDKQFTVDTDMVQAIVLLQFNAGKGAPKLQTSSIQSKSNLPLHIVQHVLSTLTQAGQSLLRQAPGSTRKSQTDMSYEVNDEFEPKTKRFAIQDEAKQTNWNVIPEQAPEKIVEDRRGHVESLLVKVMKEDKELVHKDLVAKVMLLLKFPQERPQIVERIESLIKRGFLEGYKKDKKQDGEQAMDVDEEQAKVDEDPVESMLIKYVP